MGLKHIYLQIFAVFPFYILMQDKSLNKLTNSSFLYDTYSLQSFGRIGKVICPTTPTACCLLKQQSITSLYNYCLSFLKFYLLAP
jgi:hypothetical protein